MQLTSLSEAFKLDSCFRPEWEFRDGVFTNPRFARIEHLAVAKGDKVLWDQAVIREAPGVIVVPYTLDPLEVGMVEACRPVAGVESSLEFPGGLCRPGEPWDEAAVREVAEEARWRIVGLTKLGEVNPNSAFYATRVVTCAAMVESWEGTPDGKEVFSLRRVTLNEMLEYARKGRIISGLTLAVIMLFLVKVVKNFGLIYPQMGD
ncbi:MAG: NUDIX hydrolase [Moorellaceae bacterium]